MRLQSIGEHVPQGRPPRRADGAEPSSSALPVAPKLGAIDLGSVFSAEEDARAELVSRPNPKSTARGKGTRRSAPWKAVTGQEVRYPVDTEALRHRQQEDPLLKRVTSHLLHAEMGTDPEGKLDTESYMLDDHELLCHVSAGKAKPVLAIHCALVCDLVSFIHATNGHFGVTSTNVLLRVRFHWPTMMRGVGEYILPCGCPGPKLSTSHRISMSLGHATQLWEVLEIGLMRIEVTSFTSNMYLLLAIDKASIFSLTFPLAPKHAE